MSAQARGGPSKRAFRTQWRVTQTRKNKSWESDGYLFVDGQKASFCDDTGRPMGQKTLYKPVAEDDEFSHGQKDYRVDCEITLEEYYAAIKGEAQHTLGTPARSTPAPAGRTGWLTRPGAPMAQTPQPVSRTTSVAAQTPALAGTAATPGSTGKSWFSGKEKLVKPFKPLVPASAGVKKTPSVSGGGANTPRPSGLRGQAQPPPPQPRSESGSAKGMSKAKEAVKPEDEDDPPAPGSEMQNTPPSSQGKKGDEPEAKKRKVDPPQHGTSSSSAAAQHAVPPCPPSRLSAADRALEQSLSRKGSSTSTTFAHTPARTDSSTSRPSSRPKPWDEPAPREPSYEAPKKQKAPEEPLFRPDPVPVAGPSRLRASSPLRAIKPELVEDAMELDAGMFADQDELDEELNGEGDEGGRAAAADDSGFQSAPLFELEQEQEKEARQRPPAEAGVGGMVDVAPRAAKGRGREQDAVKEDEDEDQDELDETMAEAEPLARPEQCFMVQWRKVSPRKHPVWEGDGLLTLSENGKITLKDRDTKERIAGSSFPPGHVLDEGDVFKIGKYEIEVGQPFDLSEFEVDPPPPPKPAHSSLKPPALSSIAVSGAHKPFHAPGPSRGTPLAVAHAARSVSPVAERSPAPEPLPQKAIASTSFFLPGAASGASTSKFRPLADGGGLRDPKKAAPRFDPKAQGAVVMERPTAEHEKEYNKKGLPIVDVVVDPILGDKLRDHQKEGVRFMYECVMGMRTAGQGCILADDMGLGKTIQAITLIWTLLKQNPYYGGQIGTIQRAMIVCPVTLVKNWYSEIKKWLGKDRLRVCMAESKKDLATFARSKSYDVLIVGYEKLRTAIDDIKYAQPPVGLIICDEGHRLKSTSAKTTQALQTLSCMRRVILSGTPIQNNLGEFYAMMDFVNPGLFQDAAYFKRHFDVPITRSRQPNASTKDKETGAQASELLADIQRNFVLRRTNEVNQKHLPPKLEYTVFILPTAIEIALYQQVLSGSTVRALLEGRDRQEQLSLLNNLRKLANTPGLLMQQAQTEKGGEGLGEELVDLMPRNVEPTDFALSGKLSVLGTLLSELRNTSEEKIVVISNFTKTLDIIEKHCRKMKYPLCRLDGNTPQNDRIPMVDGFNKGSHKNHFVFLLSSKSGGTGLNIIGASRLVMLDADWNPSTDAQAMARIHREGQQRTCIIYRFFTAGTIDEKIFQRQITKLALSNSVMNEGVEEAGKKSSNTFTPEELRAIFTLHEDSACETHDLLSCRCHYGESPDDGDEEDEDEAEEELGFQQASQFQDVDLEKKTQRRNLSILKTWTHYNCSDERAIDHLEDQLLRSLVYERIIQASDTEHSVEPQGNGTLRLHGGQIGWVFGKRSG
ncbi:hypothetical protein JCM10213_006186 [Rhodosporidiobolus nylandii]